MGADQFVAGGMWDTCSVGEDDASEVIVVEARRGGHVETRHTVVGAVVDVDATVVATFGDADRIYPARSTVKPLQALPLVRSGAADRFAVTPRELALACGSHGAEPGHLAAIGAWLARLGLDESVLQCASTSPPATDAIHPATRAAHNCSGKHTGWLTLAVHLGSAVEHYLDPDGPVQYAVKAAVGDACHVQLREDRIAGDGCGAPAICLSMTELARGTATLMADPSDGAAHRVLDAMTAHPWMVAGTDRYDTAINEATRGRCVSKVGADGVHVGLARDHGLAVALKSMDGSRRATEAAMSALLVALGAAGDETVASIPDTAVRNDEGRVVGEVVVRLPDSR